MAVINKSSILNIKDQGLLFWMILTLLSIGSLGFIGLWGFFNESLQALSVLIIFGFLLTMPLILGVGLLVYNGKSVSSKGLQFDDSLAKPSFFATIGFIIMATIVSISRNAQGFSVYSLQLNTLMSTFTQKMPPFSNFFVNVIMVPVIEELFFLFFIPQILFIMFDLIGESKFLSFFKNKIFQLTVIIGIVSWLFMTFHVGKSSSSEFAIASMVFRGVLIILLWGDLLFDVIPFATIGASLLVGVHIGNNWASFGLANGLDLILSAGAGIWLMALFGLMSLSGFYWFIKKVVMRK